MTEQLMDDLTNEEHEALLLMSEHGIAAPLSLAAQAVLDAYSTEADRLDREVSDNEMLAAALRAAADQVLAAEWKGRIQPDTTHMLGINWSRDALLAIAAELERQ